MLENLFYISSSGSMATHWMSGLLSSHPKLKCFHGSYGLTKTFTPRLDLDSTLKLVNTWALKNNVQYAGCVHLSRQHGVAALKECVSRDIPFCALVRNPILTVDSQFQERCRSSEFLSDIKVREYKGKVNSIPDMPRFVDVTSPEELLFFGCAEFVLRHLLEIEINNCKYFRFEDYTSDYSEILSILQFITNGKISDDYNVNIAFHSNQKTNRHRAKNADFKETWSTLWSEKQRTIFTKIWNHLLGDYQRLTPAYGEVEELIESAHLS